MMRYVGIDLHKRYDRRACARRRRATLSTFRSVRVVHALGLQSVRQDHSHVRGPRRGWKPPPTVGPWSGRLEPFVAKVTVSNPMATKAIAQAKVKTDKVDAGSWRTCCGWATFPKSGSPTTPPATCAKWTTPQSAGGPADGGHQPHSAPRSPNGCSIVPTT